MDYMSIGVEQFKEKLSNEPKKITVDEWNIDIFYKPMSLKLKAELCKYIDNPIEYAVRSLIARALDENFKKMYKPANFTEMMRHFDPDVVENIVLQMAKDEGEDSVEEDEKN